MLKIKPAPELASLTEVQLETLDGWLYDLPVSKVVQLVAAPAPDGFGLRIGRDKLRRHHLRQQVLSLFEAQRDLVEAREERKPGLPADNCDAAKLLDIIYPEAPAPAQNPVKAL